MMTVRDASGRDRGEGGQFQPFGSSPLDTMKLALVQATYSVTLAMVAAMHGTDIGEVRVQLARPGEPTKDKAWRRAAEIRSIAIYLVNTMLDIEQHFLARAAGLDNSGVCLLLRRIEDRRDEPRIERLIGFAESIVKGDE